jgi:predicted RNA binding protein with dsRBD fold (UPF0201 family)
MHSGANAPLFPEIYRQKLQQCAADGELSDEDVKALTRLRVMLCISQQIIDAAHSDICGSLFEKVIIFYIRSLAMIWQFSSSLSQWFIWFLFPVMPLHLCLGGF